MSGILDQRVQQIQALPMVPQSIPLLQRLASNPADPNTQLAAFMRLNEIKQAQQAMQNQQAMQSGAGLPSIKDQTVQAAGAMTQQQQQQQQGIQQLAQQAAQKPPVMMARGGLPDDYPEPLAVREAEQRASQEFRPLRGDAERAEQPIDWEAEAYRQYVDNSPARKRLSLREAMKAEPGLAESAGEAQYQFLAKQQAEAEALAKKQAAMNLYLSMIAGAEGSRGQGGGLRGLASIIGNMGQDYASRDVSTKEDAMKRAQALRAEQAKIEDMRRKELLTLVGSDVDEDAALGKDEADRRKAKSDFAQRMAEREASRRTQLEVANAYRRQNPSTMGLNELKAAASMLNNELTKVQKARLDPKTPLDPAEAQRLLDRERELQDQLAAIRERTVALTPGGAQVQTPPATERSTGAPPSGKVMTMADVQRTAKASGKSEQDVIAAARARGYTIK